MPRLIAALQDESEAIRREAAIAVRQIGRPAAAAIPALIQGLKDPNPTICIDFMWALTAIATAETAPTLVDEYIALLAVSEPHVKYTACYAAGSLGSAATQAIPILEANLQGSDKFLQVASAWALVRISPDDQQIAEECIDPLVRGLSLSDALLRAEAATSLGRLGLSAKRAAPALEGIRNDTDESVRTAANEALKSIQRATSSVQKGRSR